jgi:hypothetical protein
MSHVGVYIRIKHRFGPRILEWFVAWVTTLWGAVLLLPAETFKASGWMFFRAVAPEEAWGALMLLLGLGRLAGLLVNGSLPVVTPWIRIVAACCGFVVWVGISFGFALAGIVSTWLAIYPSFAIAELINIYRASQDAGESHAGETNGRSA